MRIREPESPENLDLAIAHVARAAKAWSSPPRDAHTLSALMRACAWVARCGGEAKTPSTLVSALSTPMADWLPGAPSEALVAQGEPTALCQDLLAEAGEDPEAEVVQRRIGDAVGRLRALPADIGPARYRRFREFLISNALTREEDAMLAFQGTGLTVPELYEPIPGPCLAGGTMQPGCFPCPICGWALPERGGIRACGSGRCLAKGARFRDDHTGRLAPLAGLEPPPLADAREKLRLKRGPWRYTLLPGLEELALQRNLVGLPGVRAELWPFVDAFDLLATCGARTWRIDVKDWSDPVALARSLRRRLPDEETIIAIPADRSRHVHVLEERLPTRAYRVMTVDQIVAEIRRAAKELT